MLYLSTMMGCFYLSWVFPLMCAFYYYSSHYTFIRGFSYFCWNITGYSVMWHPVLGLAHLLWIRGRRRARPAAGCPGGVCSWAGSSCCPSAECPLTSPCCTALNMAKKSPSSGSCLWAFPFSRASLYCSLLRCVINGKKNPETSAYYSC